MNGRIWVESEYKKGSTFYLEVPRISHEAATKLIEQADSVAKNQSEPQREFIGDVNVSGGDAPQEPAPDIDLPAITAHGKNIGNTQTPPPAIVTTAPATPAVEPVAQPTEPEPPYIETPAPQTAPSPAPIPAPAPAAARPSIVIPSRQRQ